VRPWREAGWEIEDTRAARTPQLGALLVPPPRFREGVRGWGLRRDAFSEDLTPPAPLSEAERGKNTATNCRLVLDPTP